MRNLKEARVNGVSQTKVNLRKAKRVGELPLNNETLNPFSTTLGVMKVAGFQLRCCSYLMTTVSQPAGRNFDEPAESQSAMKGDGLRVLRRGHSSHKSESR